MEIPGGFFPPLFTDKKQKHHNNMHLKELAGSIYTRNYIFVTFFKAYQ